MELCGALVLWHFGHLGAVGITLGHGTQPSKLFRGSGRPSEHRSSRMSDELSPTSSTNALRTLSRVDTEKATDSFQFFSGVNASLRSTQRCEDRRRDDELRFVSR